MNVKTKLRKKAVELRKKGWSYTEIQKEVSVSKSTLSLWLRDIKLSEDQKARLKEKSIANQRLGAKANRKKRISKTIKLKKKARREVGRITEKELFYLGTVLYWAEGSKQKEHNPSERVSFSNSDPFMVRIFLRWLFEVIGLQREKIDFSIYSHENIRDREKEIINYWSRITGFDEVKFDKIYYKKSKKKNYRKKQGKNYYGLLRITVKRSTDLNRKIAGWIEGICEELLEEE